MVTYISEGNIMKIKNTLSMMLSSAIKYYRLCLLIIYFTAITLSVSVNAEVILLEDFENPAVRSYQTNLADSLDDLANNDYFGQINAEQLSSDIYYQNLQGAGFYAVQDTNGALPQPENQISLSWQSINISHWNNLALSWFIAEDDDVQNNGSITEDFDSNTRFSIEIQLDNNGFFDIFAVAGQRSDNGSLTNQAPAVDTILNGVSDGIGDGVEITDSFTQFSSNIANASTLDIRVNFANFNAGEEDFAFDQLMLSGDAVNRSVQVSEPSSLALALFALVALIRRRTQCIVEPALNSNRLVTH